MNSNKQPLSKHPVIKQIGRSVSALNMPILTPLIGVLMDVKHDVEQEQSDIRRKMTDTKLEGYGAAARLIALSKPQGSKQASYFDLVEHQKRIR